MLKHDPKAGFARVGAFGRKRRFQSGRFFATNTISAKWYREIHARQLETPVSMGQMYENRRTWWLFQGEFYWEDEGLSAIEVKALLLDKQRKKARRIERAVAQMHGTPGPATRRDPIPEDVQAFVWSRDGGRCVKCGGQEHLEFDHIIPVSKGGSNTARNLQLLCETCNRSKGGSIG